MVELSGTAALVVGDMSGLGRAIARALVAADARVALVDVDQARSTEASDELARAGGTVIALPGPTELDATVARVEAELGPLALYCDVAGVRPDEVSAGRHFVACRWTARPDAAGALTLSARPLSGLAAMALLVPGALATRPACSGATAATLFGADRDRAVVENGQDVLSGAADADELADMIVGGAVSRRLIIMTRREWNGSAHQNFDGTMATVHALDEHRIVEGAELVPA